MRYRFTPAIAACAFGAVAFAAIAQTPTTQTAKPETVAPQPARRPLSPRGTASTQVLGKWEKQGEDTRYVGGKWIEIDYGRPVKRGREPLFGAGADYGKKFSEGSTVWRLGANATTKLTTEVALMLGGKKIEPGTYAMFVDLKEGAWTLIVSTQKTQEKYDPKDKSAIWGSSGYDAKFDVVRVPMQMGKLPRSVDQLTIGFVDLTDGGGQLAVAWDKELATVPFTLVP